MLNERQLKYIKDVFESNTFKNGFALVNNVMMNKNIIQIYVMVTNIRKYHSVYDYMLWLRKIRKEMYPECTFKIKRRKTPKSEHEFRNMTINELYNKVLKW